MNIQSKSHDLPTTMSVEAFFAWAAQQDRRYELVDGVPRLLPWVKRNHNRITVNIVAALARQIDSAAFEIATGDFAVTTGPGSIRYADVMVEAAGGDGNERQAEMAIVLVEVLSTSTQHVDFGAKMREYLSLVSLDTYLIIDQNNRSAWIWTRDAEGNWPSDPVWFDQPNSEISIKSISATLSFTEIYRNVS